ncbi:hypothetical protein FQA47_007893 [Oryzias melastigma]|uniref:Uncharacterized protein n=1 Tax=Oryzias melastigma TaxID=30732 RepID=A0A834CGK5_ORYME|nr:hypothetical protein FQA47_007893 [Oryzias melastigma]
MDCSKSVPNTPSSQSKQHRGPTAQSCSWSPGRRQRESTHLPSPPAHPALSSRNAQRRGASMPRQRDSSRLCS